MPNYFRKGDTRTQVEQAREREVRLQHSGAEPSSWPPPRIERAQPPPISVHEIVTKHADLWDSAKKIAVAVVTIGGIVIAAFTWAVKIVVRNEMDDLKARIDPAALIPIVEKDEKKPPSLSERFSSLAGSVEHVDQKVTEFTAGEEKRFNKLDEILLKNFGDSTSPTKPPVPPVFGPKAKQQGR
jgi:hypothetical protein